MYFPIKLKTVLETGTFSYLKITQSRHSKALSNKIYTLLYSLQSIIWHPTVSINEAIAFGTSESSKS